ncbi:putative serine protease K12H4.7 [Dugong dugon]
MARALGWLLVLLLCSCAQSFLWRQTRGASSSKEKLPTEGWFWQKLDHFSKNGSRLWRQRYFINDAFYKPGGPILLKIDGSLTANIYHVSVRNTWVTYAERLGALCLLLEHRFYGLSQPTGDLSIASLRYLSSRQALADIVNFQTKVAKKTGLTTNKWVVFGCSYGGFLAVWSRIKHPDLFAAAVGSSAPMLAKANFYEYFEGVQRSLGTYSSECLKAVKEAFLQVVEMLKRQKYYSKLKSDFIYYVQQCTDFFGPEFNYDSLNTGITSTNMYYHGFNVTGSKIIFSNGSFDPWNILGITKDISKDLPAVFIEGAGHCSDFHELRDTDSAELIQAREKIFHILQNWLKE